MDFRLFIARHYLVDWKKLSLITVISGISILSVAVGVFALIVVLSVMNGFAEVVRNLLVDIDPHIRVVSATDRGLYDADSLQAQLAELEYVTSTSAYVEGKAMLVRGKGIEANRVVLVRGVDREQLASVSSVVDRTVLGEFELQRNEGRAGIVVGSRLGQELSLFPETESDRLVGTEDFEGSQILLLSAPGIERLLTTIFGTAPVSTFEVRGWYDMETVPEFDETNVYIGIQEAQRLFRMADQVSGIELKLEDADLAPLVKANIQALLGTENVEVLTWYDLQKSLYDVMKLEKWGASLIIALIILIAAFNMVGSLTIVVMEKRHDIGVLKSMGITRADIQRIFLLQGGMIGIIGTGIGLITGVGLCVLQDRFKLVPMSGADSFILDAYPVSIQFLDISIIVTVAISLCVLASLYPAHRAAIVEPAEAVQVLD